MSEKKRDAIEQLDKEQQTKKLGQSYLMPGAEPNVAPEFRRKSPEISGKNYQIPSPEDFKKNEEIERLPPAVRKSIDPYRMRPSVPRERGDHLSGRPDWPEGPMYGPPLPKGTEQTPDKRSADDLAIKPEEDDRKRDPESPYSGTWTMAPEKGTAREPTTEFPDIGWTQPISWHMDGRSISKPRGI